MEKLFLGLLAFVPVAIAADLLRVSPTAVFFLSAIAIIPLARYIGEATEAIASRRGPALGGLLNATFGNATELIIGAFALRAGLVEVVKASITGSIVGNLLLVLGTAMFAGGFFHKKQLFNGTAAMASGSSLFLVVIALAMPAIFLQTVPGANSLLVEKMSLGVAAIMILLYAASLWFSLRTHKHLYLYSAREMNAVEGRWGEKKSIIVLLAATLVVSWVSEILVASISPAISTLGWTQLFTGVIFIAIIGNAAEHASAITVAMKNKMDLSLQIAIGSAMQIAMLVAPFLVIISSFFVNPMNLIFNSFELVAIILSVVLVNLIVADGESNWLEGFQLIVAYCIIGVAFFLHP